MKLLELLEKLNYGESLDDADAALDRVIKGVSEHHKKGKLVIALEFAPTKGANHQVEITDVITASVPEKSRQSTILFTRRSANGEIELSDRDPRQAEMFTSADAVRSAVAITAGEEG